MNVAVDPECRLVDCIAVRSIGDTDQPDIPAFMALAYRFERYQVWMLGGERMNDLGQFSVTGKTVKANGGHRLAGSQIKREVWRAWPPRVNHQARASAGALVHVPRRLETRRHAAAPAMKPRPVAAAESA